MPYDVSIDPGASVCGWALWQSGSGIFLGAGIWDRRRDLSAPSGLLSASRVIRRVYLELMEVRTGPRSLGNAADLIKVQLTGGFLAGLCRPLEIVELPPSKWKGTVPKEIHHKRIEASLSPEERVRAADDVGAVPKKHHGEVLDAIGLGLYGLGRLARGGRTSEGEAAT